MNMNGMDASTTVGSSSSHWRESNVNNSVSFWSFLLARFDPCLPFLTEKLTLSLRIRHGVGSSNVTCFRGLLRPLGYQIRHLTNKTFTSNWLNALFDPYLSFLTENLLCHWEIKPGLVATMLGAQEGVGLLRSLSYYLCDQIGRFLKFIGYKFSYKCSPNILLLFGQFTEMSLFK